MCFSALLIIFTFFHSIFGVNIITIQGQSSVVLTLTYDSCLSDPLLDSINIHPSTYVGPYGYFYFCYNSQPYIGWLPTSCHSTLNGAIGVTCWDVDLDDSNTKVVQAECNENVLCQSEFKSSPYLEDMIPTTYDKSYDLYETVTLTGILNENITDEWPCKESNNCVECFAYERKYSLSNFDDTSECQIEDGEFISTTYSKLYKRGTIEYTSNDPTFSTDFRDDFISNIIIFIVGGCVISILIIGGIILGIRNWRKTHTKKYDKIDIKA